MAKIYASKGKVDRLKSFIKSSYIGGVYISCVLCGSQESLTVDHIVPRFAAEYGIPLPEGNSNLQVLCQSCQRIKAKLENVLLFLYLRGDLSKEEFASWLNNPGGDYHNQLAEVILIRDSRPTDPTFKFHDLARTRTARGSNNVET